MSKQPLNITQVNPLYRVYRKCPLNGALRVVEICRATDFRNKFGNEFNASLWAAHLLMISHPAVPRVEVVRGRKAAKPSTYVIERAEEGDEDNQ